MKLTELEPRWFTRDDVPGYDGITFLCPHCKVIRLGVPFHQDGNRLMHEHQLLELDHPELHVASKPGDEWGMTGSTFEDISLTPSVDASASGHWHGHITNGEVK